MPSHGGARRGDLESIFARLEAQPVRAVGVLAGGGALVVRTVCDLRGRVNARRVDPQEDRLVGGGARRGRDERETTSSLSFESDTERDEPAAGLGAWFRRKR